MHHKAHIGFVNAHAEGYRSHNHIGFLVQEGILVCRPRCRVESGVIGEGADIVHPQHLGQFLNTLAAQTIYNAAFAGVVADEAHQVAVCVAILIAHLIIEVGAVEARFEHRSIRHAQILLHIVLHLGGGGSRQRYHRTQTYLFYYRPYAPVFGPEIMSPFRDAVCLVYGVERYGH